MSEKVAGRYAIRGVLGRGGFGVVYEAFDELEGRRVALKVLRLDVGSGSAPAGPATAGSTRGTEGSHRPARLADLLRDEFRILTQLHHPNLADVYDFGRSEELGGVYFTQELLEGSYLREYFADAQRRTIAAVMLQLARALDHIHALGLLHEDINPKNVLILPPQVADQAPRAKLIDFGLARLLRRSGVVTETEDRPLFGTPGYTAPERVRGQATDARSDIYALGATLYAAIRGHPAFSTAGFTEALEGQSSWHRELAGALVDRAGPVLSDLIGRMMEPEPDRRPQSARSIVLELLRREASDLLDAGGSEADREELAKVLVEHLPFVDRGGFLARLLTLAEAVAGEKRGTARPRTIVVRAPEGMGKRRLAFELRREVQLAGGLFVEGTCEGELRTGSGPFRSVVVQLAAGLGPTSKIARQHADLVKLARANSGDVETTSGLLEFLIGAGEERSYVIHLAGLAQAGEATRGVFERLVRAIDHSDAPILLVASTAPHSKAARLVAPLVRDGIAQEWSLPPFSHRETAQLLEGVLGDGPAIDDLAELLSSLAGGHPLGLRETLRSLIEESILVRDSEAWILRGSSSAAADLQRSLAERAEARLDRVGVGAWELAATLFLFESPIDEERLSELTDLRRERFERLLDRLEGEGLVVRTPVGDCATVGLAHRSVREAVRRRCADSLDETRLDIAERVAELDTSDPSLLYLRATLLDDAAEGLESLDVLRQTADRLFEAGQPTLAAKLVERRIMRLRRRGGVEGLPQLLDATLTLLNRAVGSLDNQPREEAHYRTGILVAELLGNPRAEALFWLGVADRFSGKGEHTDLTLDRLGKAADAARRAADRPLELRIASRRAEAMIQAGFVEQAEQSSRQAMEIVDLPGADEVDKCHVIGVRIRCLAFSGRLGEARRLHELGKPIAAQVSVIQRMTYLSGVAFLGILGGDPTRAIPETEQAIEELRAANATRVLITPLHNLADLHLRGAQLQEAADSFAEALRLATVLGVDYHVYLNRGFYGYTLARLGQVEEGAALLQQAKEEMQRTMGSHVSVQQLRLLDAEVAHLRGNTARARRELEEMVAEFLVSNELSMANLAQDALVRIEQETRTDFIQTDDSVMVERSDPDHDTMPTRPID